MNPTGDFSRFKDDILKKYSDYDEITFGILIVDPRQTEAREYILNYLSVFHEKSGKAFDFFIPGYHNVKIEQGNSEHCFFDVSSSGNFYIHKNSISFHFSEKMFNNFCKTLHEYFNIAYTFNPMLIIMSMKPGYLGTAKYIVIELDDNERHSARRSGQFFLDLFRTVESDNSLIHIQKNMSMTYLKGNLIDSIVKSIGAGWLIETKNIGSEMKRYSIKG